MQPKPLATCSHMGEGQGQRGSSRLPSEADAGAASLQPRLKRRAVPSARLGSGRGEGPSLALPP